MEVIVQNWQFIIFLVTIIGFFLSIIVIVNNLGTRIDMLYGEIGKVYKKVEGINDEIMRLQKNLSTRIDGLYDLFKK